MGNIRLRGVMLGNIRELRLCNIGVRRLEYSLLKKSRQQVEANLKSRVYNGGFRELHCSVYGSKFIH